MSKKISLEVKSCAECPYYGYNNVVEEQQCNLLDKLLFFDDTNVLSKDRYIYSTPIIFKDCPLEDV